ncbi:MAG: hypothetical protein J6W55_03940 [Acidaminococcaceae bacterium]|nr:hypothetical protein [Acidaminococcaceae bacterium]
MKKRKYNFSFGFVKLLAAFLVTLAVSVPCFAQIAKENMVLGGLYIGQSYSEVMDLYGMPTGIMRETEEPGRVFSFAEKNGTEFNVRIVDDRVAGIELFGKNTLSTKAGIRIGSAAKKVKKAYGKPDEQRGTENDGVMYYKCDVGDRHTWGLVIEVRAGKVSSMELKEMIE